MKNSQEFTQEDIAHLYSMHLATIRTEYKIISLAHNTHSRRFLLLLHAGSKLHSSDCFCVLCILYFSLYFSLFSCYLDLLLCVFSSSASGLQICYNKVELS